jgi:hypothetical protein
MQQDADTDSLETFLVEAEIQIEHLVNHRNSLAEKLGYSRWTKLEGEMYG